MFRPGPPNLKPHQWHDPLCSVLPIGEASHSNLPLLLASTPYLHTYTSMQTLPSSIPPFRPRPPITSAHISACKRNLGSSDSSTFISNIYRPLPMPIRLACI